MRAPKRPFPVLVEWVDATVNYKRGWDLPSEHVKNTGLTRCSSVGFLLKRSRRGIMIAQSTNGTEVADTITIPAGCVQRVRRLK